MSDQSDLSVDDGNEAIETEALEMGWVPKDKFRGDDSKWVDASTFVDRGKHLMPILQANNRKLQQESLTQKQKIDNLEKAVEAATSSIKVLKKSYSESVVTQVAEARKQLREQLRAARDAGDLDAELEIDEKLGELKAAEQNAKKESTEEDTPLVSDKDKGLHPDFISWRKENPWMNPDSPEFDQRKTVAWTRAGEDLRMDGDTTRGKASFDKCKAIVEASPASKGAAQKTVSKVEGSTPGSRQGSGGGRRFDSLPKEAKEICHEDNDLLVGPGKKFKTVKEWEDEFANLYNAE